jgi:serine/threonine protein kinase
MALLREEIIMCEKLMHHPHPGIAKYYGVVVQDGRILGLAFKKYRRCLDEFDGTEPDCPSIENVCASIQAGIGHLHGLGVVHNDINPGNICIDEDGRAVIIDFNSARPTGERLGLRGGTTGFCRDTKISEEQNDLYGLRAIRAHLQFVFKGEVSHN